MLVGNSGKNPDNIGETLRIVKSEELKYYVHTKSEKFKHKVRNSNMRAQKVRNSNMKWGIQTRAHEKKWEIQT